MGPEFVEGICGCIRGLMGLERLGLVSGHGFLGFRVIGFKV